jgi:SOS regulatory protein LexA
VVPEARSPEAFSWADCQATLDSVRSTLKGNNPNAATELRRAFIDAYQMAEHCYDQLVEMEPEEALPDGAFKDWRIFLAGLFKDAWNVYPKHSLVKLDKQKDLQVTIGTICKAAEDALFDLLDMHESRNRRPSQRRRPLVDKLRKLMTELESARAELEPPPKVAEVHRVEDMRKADRTEELEDADQAHHADDANYVTDTPKVIHPTESVPVPLLGRIAAGDPTLAEQSIEEILALPKRLAGQGELFWLKIADDSMINASIANGDWVVVRQDQEAENGEIVAAIIGGEATVKIFNQSDERTWLASHNPAYPEIPADEATILGKVVAVLHRVR